MIFVQAIFPWAVDIFEGDFGLSQISERVFIRIRRIPKKPEDLWPYNLAEYCDEDADVKHQRDAKHPVQKVRGDWGTEREGDPLR